MHKHKAPAGEQFTPVNCSPSPTHTEIRKGNASAAPAAAPAGDAPPGLPKDLPALRGGTWTLADDCPCHRAGCPRCRRLDELDEAEAREIELLEYAEKELPLDELEQLFGLGDDADTLRQVRDAHAQAGAQFCGRERGTRGGAA